MGDDVGSIRKGRAYCSSQQDEQEQQSHNGPLEGVVL